MDQNVPPSDVDIGLSDNCLTLGREFPDIDALRNALSDMAVMTGREYKHVRTSSSKLKMKCKAEDCKWSIQATRLSSSPAFKVIKYKEVHICTARTNSGDEDHPQATVGWILLKMQTNIEKDPYMEPTKIVEEMKDRYKIKISYNKAVKVKRKALEVMRNGRRDLNPVPDVDICRALKVELERSSATICKLGVNSDGGTFPHFFWSFQACIDALRNHLRPVVYVGSVNTEIGVLMFARGVDGNSVCDYYGGNLIEVGFGFCVNEDEKLSWETFLIWLKEFVLPPITAEGNYNNTIPFSIVTDFGEPAGHYTCLFSKIIKSKDTAGLTCAVENVLPHLHHFFTQDRKSYFYNAFSTEKCEADLEKLRTFDKESYDWLFTSKGSKSHWAIAFSPNKHAFAVSGLRRSLFTFEQDFESVRKSSSIVEMVERSREKVAKYFSERRIKGEDAATTTGLAPHVMRDIQRAKNDLPYCKVQSIGRHKYQVTEVGVYFPHYQEVVDLEEKSCTCGKFQATEYPCEHALVVILHLDLDVRNYMSHRWYSLQTYRATYAGILPPPISDHILQWETAITEIPNIPPKRGRVGRPPKRAAKKINLVG